jgi:hypothetical protein
MGVCNIARMNALHADLKIRGDSRLVHDDVDRVELVRRTSRAFGPRLLAYCVMDTHLHVVVEASEPDFRSALDPLFLGYTRFLNARRGTPGQIRRGDVNVLLKNESRLVAKAIEYDHKNPLRVKTPTISHEIVYEWSSAREYSGLARTTHVNAQRALALVGANARWGLPGVMQLDGLDRSPVPTVVPGLILAAAAQTYGVLVEEVLSERRSEALVTARRVFMTLGRLEGYSDGMLAPTLERSRSRANSFASDATDFEGVRAARTLLHLPELRARLRCLPAGDWRATAKQVVTQP